MPTNEQRADRAYRAMDYAAHYYDFSDDLEERIVDLVTDLLHAAHLYTGLDIERDVFGLARMHFEEEIEEESTTTTS